MRVVRSTDPRTFNFGKLVLNRFRERSDTEGYLRAVLKFGCVQYVTPPPWKRNLYALRRSGEFGPLQNCTDVYSNPSTTCNVHGKPTLDICAVSWCQNDETKDLVSDSRVFGYRVEAGTHEILCCLKEHPRKI